MKQAHPGLIITKVDATVVRVPRLARFRPRTSKGSPTHSEYVVVEIHTDGGLAGLGEATTSPAWNGEDAVGTADLVERLIGPDLVGLSADDWRHVSAVIDGKIRGRPFLRTAVEMACLDLEGRARGLPVAELLGGVWRTRFDTRLVLPAREPSDVAAMTVDALAAGAVSLKVKVGLDLATDVNRLTAVREAAGETPISIDANEGWHPIEHDSIARQIAPIHLVAVEQPFPRAAVVETRLLRTALETAVVADESVWDASDLASAVESGAFSDVALYPGKVGGMRRCVKLAADALAQGLDVSYGSNLELGIGAAAMAHSMAATPALSRTVASDLIGPLYFEHALIEDASFVDYAGATLPGGVGLGVRLDRDALAEYSLSPRRSITA